MRYNFNKMSDFDLERTKEYHLIDNRFSYVPRKRVPHNGHKSNYEEETQILINGDIDGKPMDPEFSDLLREYDGDSDDSEVCVCLCTSILLTDVDITI